MIQALVGWATVMGMVFGGVGIRNHSKGYWLFRYQQFSPVAIVGGLE